MAMLAEPRRKQKWSVDPRNCTWSNDESKFGQKLMEKMGWSKGKGLGAQEQGSTEHIKVKVKNNSLGLGASVTHEDNWIAHQDDFNQILAELNTCHGSEESERPANEDKKTFSLEEKSKSSRKRVHYMKFAKGKDLSSRSETDLACIFGKREKVRKATPEEETAVDSEVSEEKEKQSPPSDCEPRNTVTSSLSVNEYFAKRMAELKKSHPKRPESVQQISKSCLGDPAKSGGSSEAPKQKTKKKKRSKCAKNLHVDSAEEHELVENPENGDCLSNAEFQVPRKRSKNKRKSKAAERPESTETVVEEEEPTRTSKSEGEDGEIPKKRKKNKRRFEPSEEKERGSDSRTEAPEKKKKKRSD
ncbi:PIN2/TERF1-interacting telomerase inhibitor 1 isoform X1 [Ascaphus truei]|uniref:PIN2/TERF1-interacting telomerase inhibitor 1 isoform X1 n=1 Tax=Ascaphus truei TaxID=8439 RepID=UPI003F593860